MRKIGILTLNGYFNYGNRLQNYALQEVLKSYGFEVETIINKTQRLTVTKKNTFEKIKNVSKKPLSKTYRILKNKIANKLYKEKLNELRTNIFKEFSCSYINETNFSIIENNIPDSFSERYDYFVTGSDQVWNPYYRHGSSVDFLKFADKQKRIAYSPSFGIEEIPNEYSELYSKYLSEMHKLSVREMAGAKIIKELTGKDVPVLIDPTLLLSKEKWLSISNVPPNKPLKKYILTYFLGDIPKKRNNYIKSIAKRNDLEIVNLAQINEKASYLTGPSEFIDYINSASVLLTDSFHGAVFSMLLETPFVVFNRSDNQASMNSRFDTLLSTFQLESRLFDNIGTDQDIFEIDYSHVAPILEFEREKAFNYLKDALNIKN